MSDVRYGLVSGVEAMSEYHVMQSTPLADFRCRGISGITVNVTARFLILSLFLFLLFFALIVAVGVYMAVNLLPSNLMAKKRRQHSAHSEPPTRRRLSHCSFTAITSFHANPFFLVFLSPPPPQGQGVPPAKTPPMDKLLLLLLHRRNSLSYQTLLTHTFKTQKGNKNK